VALSRSGSPTRGWRAASTWAVGFGLLVALDGHVDLGNQALVLVATAAVATLWMSGWGAAMAALAAVGIFNWMFVPPREDLRRKWQP